MPIDYSKYPPNWKSEIVPRIISRANNCCEQCSVPNKSLQWRGRKKVKLNGVLRNRTFHYNSEEDALTDGCTYCSVTDLTQHRKGNINAIKEIGIYQTKVVLTIAHLDHDELNWDVKDERLRAWCQLCHLQYDAKEKYRRSQSKPD